MKKLPFVLAALATAPSIALAEPKASITRVEESKEYPGQTLVQFKASGVCGDYPASLMKATQQNGTLVIAFTVIALKCKAGEKPRDAEFLNSINLANEARVLGMTTVPKNAKYDINLKLE